MFTLLNNNLGYQALTNQFSGSIPKIVINNLIARTGSISDSLLVNKISPYSGSTTLFTGIVKAPNIWLTDNTAQIKLGSTFTTTISSTPTSNRSHEIPDVPNANFVMSEGLQIINAPLIFTGAINISTLNPSEAVVTDASGNLVSMEYTPNNVNNTIPQRDGLGAIELGGLTTPTVTSNSALTLAAPSSTVVIQTLNPMNVNNGIQCGTVVSNSNNTYDLGGLANVWANLYAANISTSSTLTDSLSSKTTNGDLTVSANGTGKILLNDTVNVSSLTASQAVVTDFNKNLSSLPYDSANTANALMQRNGANACTLTTLNADTINKSVGDLNLTTTTSGDIKFTSASTNINLNSNNLINGAVITATTLNTGTVNNTSADLVIKTTTSGDVSLQPASGLINVNSNKLKAVAEINRTGGDITLQTITSGGVIINTAALGSGISLNFGGTTKASVTTSGFFTNGVGLLSGTDFAISSTTVTMDSTSGFTTQSFTPTIGDGTNNFTLSTAVGRYYQKGKEVHVDAVAIWSSKGSASGNLRFSLPLTSANISTYRACGRLGFISGVTSLVQLTCGVNNNNSYVLIYKFVSGSSGTVLQASDCAASGEIHWSIDYLTP